MTQDVPRPRPLYLHRQVTRHGKAVWYVRKGARGQKIRIRGEYGSDAFMAQYEAAITGQPMPPPKGPRSGSLSWLIEQYRETSAWAELSPATRRQRENIFLTVIGRCGSEPYSAISPRDIEAGKDARRSTPSQARNYLDAMRGLFRWAKGKHLKYDPTDGIGNPKRPDTGGFAVWTEDDVAAYQAKWPLGTRERVWLDVLLYTGFRRGDAVRLGRQHIRDGIATLKTEKTGVEVAIPILPVLAATIAAGPCGDLAFICGEAGHPLTKESFGNLFRGACRAVGVTKSAHGVRKIAATTAANNGATVAELEALFGWQGGQMAALYTKAADRRKLAKAAAEKLNKSERSMCSPSHKVGTPGR
jgi:integrase